MLISVVIKCNISVTHSFTFRATTSTEAFDYTEGKYTKLVKEKPLQIAGEVLPVVTYALDDERTTYISQETAPTTTGSMMGSKSDIKRQTAQGTAG